MSHQKTTSLNIGLTGIEIEAHISRLQRQLANAVEHGNLKADRHYKWLIRNSHHAKMLAIRKVTQENNGRNTPRIEGQVYSTPEKRDELLKLAKTTWHSDGEFILHASQ
jgi:hypothetical protein